MIHMTEDPVKPTPMRSTHFKCTRCGEIHPKEEGRAVRVTFYTLTRPTLNRRSRTTGKVCMDCLESDPVYTMEKHVGNRQSRSPRLDETSDEAQS